MQGVYDMLKGAIDYVSANSIGGWLFTSFGDLDDTVVLAFSGATCVGSGKIDVFRPDLLDAGMGDGRLGFSFPISVKDESEASRVYVKLEGSDAVILQPEKITPTRRKDLFQTPRYSAETLEWMRLRGWFAPDELLFLKGMARMGCMEYSFIPRSPNSGASQELRDHASVAKELLSLISMSENAYQSLSVIAANSDDLVSQVAALVIDPYSIVALHSERPIAVQVVEGSHTEESETLSLDGAISYHGGSGQLLFLDLTTRFELPNLAGGVSLTVHAVSAA
jgi:hypothetical protein